MYVIKKIGEEEFLDIPNPTYKIANLVSLDKITRPYNKRGSASNSLTVAFTHQWRTGHLYPLTKYNFEIKQVELKLK